jgi:DNA primase large subunit
VRRRLWFKVLSAAERAIVDLTLKVVERVRSSVLKEVLKSIASKLIEALKSRSFKERAMAIGRVLAERHARIAERLGNKRAREWAEDPNFVMYLGASWLNTPRMFKHAL